MSTLRKISISVCTTTHAAQNENNIKISYTLFFSFSFHSINKVWVVVLLQAAKSVFTISCPNRFHALNATQHATVCIKPIHNEIYVLLHSDTLKKRVACIPQYRRRKAANKQTPTSKSAAAETNGNRRNRGRKITPKC